VAVYSRLAFGLFLLSLGGVGLYYTWEVLNPGRMGPFKVFSDVTDRLMLNDEVRFNICYKVYVYSQIVIVIHGAGR